MTKKQRLINFKKLWAVIEKNFIVLTRDKARIIPLILMPIVMIVVFGFISGNTPKHLATALIVYDNSPLSEQLQQVIANNDVLTVRYVVSTEGEARNLLDRGKVSAIVEIPQGLQDSIDSGNQVAINVIVDESDAAVGSAATQTLRAIVSEVSWQVSDQKIKKFQSSVGQAAKILQAAATKKSEQYGIITTQLDPAHNLLQRSVPTIQVAIQQMTASLPEPRLYIPPKSVSDYYHHNITYLVWPPSYGTTKAQIALLEQLTSITSTAAKKVFTAEAIAQSAHIQNTASQDYESIKQNIDKPMATINTFVSSSPDNILIPLIYKDKPAYGTGKRAIDFLIPAIIALTIFQGALMGMGRAVAGEKREGSLTRVFLTPTSNATIILGTLSFYTLFELFRSSFIIFLSVLLFNIEIEGNLLLVGLILIVYAGVCTSIGMLFSSMVKTEQQFTAMAMLVSMPTILLAGAFFPVQAMPPILQNIAKVLPVTYAAQALRGVMIKGFSLSYIAMPMLVLLAFLAVMISLVFIAFKRDIE